MTWKNIEFNSNNIQSETGRATLIKIPKCEYKFWHPSKLVRKFGKRNYMLSLGYTDDFTFKVFKNGKGKYNCFEKVEELELSATEFIDRFFTTLDDES